MKPAPRKAVLIQPSEAATPLSAPAFLSQSIPTTVIETTNEALPIWRTFAKNRPALIFIANTPALIPVPEEFSKEAESLLKNSDDKEILRKSNPLTPAPLILPSMSLGLALDSGWFSQVVWVFPSTLSPERLDLTTFKQQLIDAHVASDEEADSFVQKDGSFNGIIHGRPFTAAHADALPTLSESALLHVDADYFKPLYKGEIKTPIYPLIAELLNKIKDRNWKIAAATVALSNLQLDGLPLQTRFIGKDLAAILVDPQILHESFPTQWERRSNVLYLENFMQKEEIRRVYREMAKDDPVDAAVQFGLYNISRQTNQTSEALNYLSEAVRIDPVYAREYLSLSELAMQKKRPEKALEMLQLARKAQPDDPFILLLAVRTLLNTGHTEEAKGLKSQLAGLSWSKTYYPEEDAGTSGLLSLLQ